MELMVDNQSIEMNAFVQTILKNVVKGILLSLDGIPENAHKVSLSVQAGDDVDLSVDETPIKMNAFVCRIVSNILQACVTSLEGVSPDLQKIQLDLFI